MAGNFTTPDVTARVNSNNIAKRIRSDVFLNPVYGAGCNPSETDADKTVEDDSDAEPHPVKSGGQNPPNMPKLPQQASCKLTRLVPPLRTFKRSTRFSTSSHNFTVQIPQCTGIGIALTIAAMLALAMITVGTWLYLSNNVRDVQKPTRAVVDTTYTPVHPNVDTTYTPGHPNMGTTYTSVHPNVDTTYTPGHPNMGTTYTPVHPNVDTTYTPGQPNMGTTYTSVHPNVDTSYTPGQPNMGTTYTPVHPNVDTSYTPGHPNMGTTYTPVHPNVDTTYTPGHPNMGTTYTPVHPNVGTSYTTGQPIMGTTYTSVHNNVGTTYTSDHPVVDTTYTLVYPNVDTTYTPDHPAVNTTNTPDHPVMDTTYPSVHPAVDTTYTLRRTVVTASANMSSHPTILPPDQTGLEREVSTNGVRAPASSSQKGPVAPTRKWRDDFRCGKGYPAENGKPAECDPDGKFPCCSPGNWCGNSKYHCDCSGCVDFRKGDWLVEVPANAGVTFETGNRDPRGQACSARAVSHNATILFETFFYGGPWKTYRDSNGNWVCGTPGDHSGGRDLPPQEVRRQEDKGRQTNIGVTRTHTNTNYMIVDFHVTDDTVDADVTDTVVELEVPKHVLNEDIVAHSSVTEDASPPGFAPGSHLVSRRPSPDPYLKPSRGGLLTRLASDQQPQLAGYSSPALTGGLRPRPGPDQRAPLASSMLPVPTGGGGLFYRQGPPPACRTSSAGTSQFIVRVCPITKEPAFRSQLSAIVPDDWKLAKISPIHKSGNRDSVSNYRPVSVLNVASKVMEKMVHNQVSHFVNSTGQLTAHQSGFRKHHSTGTAVQKVVEDIQSAQNNKKVTVALFLDLRKAFDTVNHQILLGKLQKMGFDNGATNWFRSYLTDRFQHVDIQNQQSTRKRVTCGVPQGSVLETLLAEAGMVPLAERVKLNTLVTVHKAVRHKAPAYMTHMFKWLSPPVLRVRTRTATKQLYSFDPHMLDTPKAHVESFKGSLQYQGPVLWNCLAADQRQLIATAHVADYITKERDHGATIGPLPLDFFDPALVCNPLQTVPKKDSNSRRIVVDFSFPDASSVNAGIPTDTYLGEHLHLRYPSVDDLTAIVVRLGPGCLLYKRDLRRAYRQIYVDPADYHLLGFQWKGLCYADVVYSFGIRTGALVCQRVTDAVRFISGTFGYACVNYLDDLGGADTPARAPAAFEHFGHLLALLGLQEADDKAVPPTTRLVFLGRIIDSVRMTIEVTPERLTDTLEELRVWSSKVHTRRRDVESLPGKLQFIASCVRPGRLFVSRMLLFLKQFPDRHTKLRTTDDFRRDLAWWRTFLPTYNGISLLPQSCWTEADAVFSSDACLTGCGGFLNPTG
ncbi:cytoplasmic pattern recognition receptor signaling pathway in response to virus [Branchiostoma belcheri]|nr:cytoplasmic pattern recognition receptor signaling pathway in response to virus [Branchiostoma belcheri]